ncbi:MAG: BppU family phage baseplate upper protein [Anaerovoracaceae bacterium]|jgi:hypothetical protein
MADFHIKVGDTLPAIQGTLYQGDGTVISLVSASAVRFHMRKRGTSDLLVDGACEIVNASGGVVRYTWEEGDFSESGQYEAEFEVTFTSGDVATVPNNKHLSIVITAELG